MQDNYIELKNIKSLSGLSFFIPDYQRGYRWTEDEVNKMLDDFKEFCDKKNTSRLSDGEFYCLQPIVVKKRIDGSYEVLDGQQRLTTLYLLIKFLYDRIEEDHPDFKLYNIEYETREESSSFLQKIDSSDCGSNDCVDFFYIREVYNTIKNWFKTNSYRGKFSELLLDEVLENSKDLAHNIRIIWYEIGDSEKSSSTNIFTRLNIGKIPLTNAELIKALFLRKSNFIPSSLKKDEIESINNEINLRRQTISTEWNTMEKRLQEDSFWYFLRRKDERKKIYDTRMEYIFDLMSDKKEDSEFYHSFNYFNHEFTKYPNVFEAIDSIWDNIKSYFQEFEYWYNDRKLYHLIGYLIEYGVSVSKLKELSKDKSKSQLLKEIDNQIKDQIKGININTLDYKDRKKTHKVLLLFNILSVISDESIDTRFPFDKFKKENWDIEHIASQSGNSHLRSNKASRMQWVNDILSYFLDVECESIVDLQILKDKAVSLEESEKSEIVNGLIKIKELADYSDDSQINELYEKALHYFKSDILTDDEKDKLFNLALLNSDINRSYGDAFFPVKRMIIKKNDKLGRFIPLATKNVFMKYYSNNISNATIWSRDDATAYFTEINKLISKYL